MENLSLYVLTWNVATKSPNESVRLALDLPKNKSNLPDFYLIGLQEVKSQPQNMVSDSLFDNAWTNAFRNMLVPYDYVKVKSVRLIGLVLTLFSLRKHVTHIRDIQLISTKTGLFGLWGNKGAVTIHLKIYGCSLCFVNVHLAPHDHAVKDRIEDYNTILNSQTFESTDATKIMFHDYIFWFGDLNFRIKEGGSLSALEIDRQIKSKDFKELLQNDELREVMRSGEAFSELVESEITFAPTYKFNLNSEEYDLKRRPAWTDRILYRVNENAYENIKLETHQQYYNSISSYGTSDHKPVAARFIIKVFSNHVEKQVRFFLSTDWRIDEENCFLVVFDSDVRPSNADWIGIFRDNFTSLDDYVSYLYLPHSDDEQCPVNDSISVARKSSSSDQLELLVKFSDQLISEPGLYRLVYFTKDSSNILGISPVVTVTESAEKRPLDW